MKFKRIYIFLFVIVIGIMIVSQAQSLLANYNIVEDMNLQTSVTSLKEGETVAITVTDSNVEDTKLVIPIDKTMEYVESDHLDGSVVFDTINNQLVIDWMDSSNEQKAVTVMLKMNKEGLYPLKILTVRENQEVSTKEVSLDVVGFNESQVENMNIEGSTSSEQSVLNESNIVEDVVDTNESQAENTDTESSTNSKQSEIEEPVQESLHNVYELLSGTWGSVPWTFDKELGLVTVESGVLADDYNHSHKLKPWDLGQPLYRYRKNIKKIEFIGKLVVPEGSSKGFEMFTQLEELTTISGLSNLDTSSVRTMQFWFSSTPKLKSLDMSGFDTSNVRNMGNMFSSAGMETLDLKGFDTSNVTNMENMFNRAKIKNLDLSSFDTSSVTHMSGMFESYVPQQRHLRSLTLGDQFKFMANAALQPPLADRKEGDKLTGDWTREDGNSKPYSPKDFMANYGTGDLTAGTYVADIIPYGRITAETKLTNQTHSDGLFYVNDVIKLQNEIHHEGEVWNYRYKTIIPDELTINKESFIAYEVTEEGARIELPNEVFKFDESSRILEMNLKAISEVDNKGNYYSLEERNFYYEFTTIINKEAIGKKIRLDTTINYFDKIFTPYQDVELSVESKELYGLEPEWKLEKKIKNTSRSDEITAVGDELEFTLTATNKEALGAMKSFAIAETMFPNELDFIRGSAELILSNGMIKTLDDSVYQADNQIISTDVFSENGYVGVEPYSFRFKAKVKDVAYGKILETKANLNGLTQTGNVVNIDDNKVEINVAYSGKLGFKETPKTLSFKDSFISTFTSTIERKDVDWGISIEDTRAQKQPWTLSVKQASPFESMDGDTLTQVLIFRKNGVEDKGIDVENEVDVYSENSPNLNDYFVSWQKDEGFFLKVPPGTAKAKQYQTELQWNLKDTPI